MKGQAIIPGSASGAVLACNEGLSFWGGVLDHIGAFILRIMLSGESFLFFADGFGSMDSLVEVDDYVTRMVDGSEPVPELSIEWSDPSEAEISRDKKKSRDQKLRTTAMKSE